MYHAKKFNRLAWFSLFFLFFSCVFLPPVMAQKSSNYGQCISKCMKECRDNPPKCIGDYKGANIVKQKLKNKFCEKRCKVNTDD